MEIDRHEYQGGSFEALRRVKFCLDYLEKEGFIKGTDWDTQITKRLTLEEVVGALVSSEQHLKDFMKYDMETELWALGYEEVPPCRS